jgi:hypothetical protein
MAGCRFTATRPSSQTPSLDNKGLHGDGDLTYLTTIASSKNLVFTPDTTFGMADTLRNTGSTGTLNVPDIQAGKVQLRLEPAKDVLLAQSTEHAHGDVRQGRRTSTAAPN